MSKKPVSIDEVTIGYADVVRTIVPAELFDEIIAELPEGYVFTDVIVFLGFLSILIDAQWHGGRNNKSEPLAVKDGDVYNNIFFVKVDGEILIVRVHWYGASQAWHLDADRQLGAQRWHRGFRIFSATAT